MRMLTLSSYLKKTLQNLSENNNTAPYKLAEEVVTNPRLLEPLCLYVVCLDDKARKDRLIDSFPIIKNQFFLHTFLRTSNKDTLEMNLASISDKTNRYYKLWQSYVSVRDRKEADNHTKTLIHVRVRELQKSKDVSNYRVYTALKLNPGNVNAFLKHGNCSKVSLDTARSILRYLKQL